jgi:hypothetical protein
VRSEVLRHEFVDEVPDELEAGVLYVSIEFRTTVHLCSCGCGNVVTLPLRPAAWRLTYDGETISISPSVGNWSFPCRSHYWIRNSRIQWAGGWTNEQVAVARERALIERGAEVPSATSEAKPLTRKWLRRVFDAISGR